MLVEKIDLVGLFEPICREYGVALANTKGWADIHVRAELMRRCAEAESRGKICVLLYCGDHDPAGLWISERLIENLRELSGAVGWEPDNLIIERFGLNFDFIERLGLTWVDNLLTASGKDLADARHPDHFKPWVQDYIRQFGARKLEANALVTAPVEGRALCRRAILRYFDQDAERARQERNAEARHELAVAVAELVPDAAEELAQALADQDGDDQDDGNDE
jgi:hypothetical protein